MSEFIHIIANTRMLVDLNTSKGEVLPEVKEWLEERAGKRCGLYSDMALGMTFRDSLIQDTPCSQHNWGLVLNSSMKPTFVFRDAQVATLFKLTFA